MDAGADESVDVYVGVGGGGRFGGGAGAGPRADEGRARLFCMSFIRSSFSVLRAKTKSFTLL